MEQRRDLGDFEEGLRAWLAGEDSLAAVAAGRNVAELLLLWRMRLTGGE